MGIVNGKIYVIGGYSMMDGWMKNVYLIDLY